MRAVLVTTFGGPEQARIARTDLPVPGPGQVRIRNEALAVHPADLAVRAGHLAALLPEQSAYRLGWDTAGVVDAVGAGVESVRPGDRVIGLIHWFASRNGTHGDQAVLPADAVAPAPAGLTAAEAVTLPLNGLTALQALDTAADTIGLREGGTLLVTGAAGGVGHFATQLALHRGLRVIAVARAGDRGQLLALGAEFVEGAEDGADTAAAVRELVPAGVDAVLDTALTGAPLLAAVRADGLFLAVRPPAAPAPERGIRVHVVDVRPDGGGLAELAELAEGGALTTRIAAAYPLDQVAAAHAHAARGGVRGAVVLTV
ncbi:NADP-dependent oxidoreductase [Kitasatospora sp. MBT63]|uniref:NADP-dependent oxidoreductase n=1 Tax=Kitasatospora sp. MBT63 TaxID=1444768 RepID=UPI00053BA3F6|nr:NADP-dependent oxidoreductase [Kitasatospora sp. MBT63]